MEKKILGMLLGIVTVVTLFLGCENTKVDGKTENIVTTADDESNTAKEDLMDTSNDNQIKEDVELENLIGEYDYLSDDGIGKLIIKKTPDGYDISDYESESSYRFLADSSNIETIENNRIYIKYPEQVFSDDTVIFHYYILEYTTNEITVYYTKSVLEEDQLLYHATKKKEDTN